MPWLSNKPTPTPSRGRGKNKPSKAINRSFALPLSSSGFRYRPSAAEAKNFPPKATFRQKFVILFFRGTGEKSYWQSRWVELSWLQKCQWPRRINFFLSSLTSSTSWEFQILVLLSPPLGSAFARNCDACFPVLGPQWLFPRLFFVLCPSEPIPQPKARL